MGTLDIEEARVDLSSDEPERRARGADAIRELQRRGDPVAAYAVATWMLAGAHGHSPSQDDAAPYLQYAADHGVRDAIFDLAVLVESRRLGKRPRREAFSRYITAAMLGDRDAAFEVVRCIYHGVGTFADPLAAERIHDALEAAGGGGAQPAIAAE